MNFLKQQEYRRIGLFGGSMGGGAAILAAAKANDIFCLALKSPVVDFQQLLEFRQKKPEQYNEQLQYGFYRDSKNFSGLESLKKINVPTILVHGTAYIDVPCKFFKEATKIFPKIELELITGADHRYSNPKHFQQMLTLLSNFILKEAI